jgi:hypothetical protein
MATEIDMQEVLNRLSQQIGALSSQLAMTSVALDAAEKRIAELEGESSATPRAA